MADEQHLQDMFQTAGRDEASPPAFDDIDLPEQPVAIKCNACLLDSFAEKDMSRVGLVCLLCDVLEPEVCKDVRERYRAANPVLGSNFFENAGVGSKRRTACRGAPLCQNRQSWRGTLRISNFPNYF